MTSFKTTKVADKLIADSWKMDKVAKKVKEWKLDNHFYFWKFLNQKDGKDE